MFISNTHIAHTFMGHPSVAPSQMKNPAVFSARSSASRSAWGGHRQDYQSCGFNHQPMAQAGGCTARDSKQKAGEKTTVPGLYLHTNYKQNQVLYTYYIYINIELYIHIYMCIHKEHDGWKQVVKNLF